MLLRCDSMSENFEFVVEPFTIVTDAMINSAGLVNRCGSWDR